MYNFKEKNLSQDFCQLKIAEAQRLINLSVPFTVVGMPTAGISFFLKFLATRDFAKFIHIDINELPSISKNELLKLILKELSGKTVVGDEPDLMEKIKIELSKLVSKHDRVVLVFNRFDRLQSLFDQNFFANLRTLWEVDKEKIVLVFTANKPLTQIAPEAVSGGNLNLCGKVLYLTPHSGADLIQLVKMNAPNLLADQQRVRKALELGGGHYQLSLLLLKSDDLLKNPIADPVIGFQLKELTDFLNKKQQNQLQQIILDKKLTAIDPFLVNVGFVKPNGSEVFSPLFKSYLLTHLDLKLPQKEQKLFKLLKSKNGKIVTKEEIFDQIWDQDEEASDWALDSLIYRLRKNPVFTTQYLLESHKKQGYSLIKI